MPLDWSMELTHSDLFQLAHHILVEPWDKSAMSNWNPTRKAGWRPGLAFSGGVDSAAALCLMPEETVLVYNERTGIQGKLNHTNAFRFFENLNAVAAVAFTVSNQITRKFATHKVNPSAFQRIMPVLYN